MTKTGYKLVDGDAAAGILGATPRHWIICAIAMIVAQWVLSVGYSVVDGALALSIAPTPSSGILGLFGASLSGINQHSLLFQFLMFVYIAGPFVLVGGLALYLSQRFDGRGPRAAGLSWRAVSGAQPFVVVGLIASAPVWLGFFRHDAFWYEQALVPLIALAPGTLLQSGAEEVLFRGMLLPMLAARYGGGRGLLISAVLFALWHVYPLQPAADVLVRAGTTFVAGLTLGVVALRQGHLGGAIALHFAWNLFVGLEAGLGSWSQGFWEGYIASLHWTWTFAELANGASLRELILPLAIEAVCIMLICRTTVLRLLGGKGNEDET